MVPVFVITGFLGAGKTTLLNRVLAAWSGRRVGVLVNDFGTVDVDGTLVRGADTVVPLAGGCVCCTLQASFVAAATSLLEGRNREGAPSPRPPPEALIVEASGVSEPGPLLAALGAPGLRRRARLDGVVAVVDASEARGFMARRQQALLDAQVQAASLVVLNKTDLATPGEVRATRDWLAAVAPEARVFTTAHAEVPPELLVGAGAGRGPAGTPDHAAGFATATFTSSLPFSLPRLRAAVRSAPPAVFRAKGEVSVAGRRRVLHVAGRYGSLGRPEPWGEDLPRSAVVAIGPADALDDASLAAWLEPALETE